MSKNVPTGYKMPTNIITLESQIVHDILVASRIYQNEKVIEDDNNLRDVITYFPFVDGTGKLRFGFRGSFEIDPAWTAGNQENKDFWEYVLEHAIVSLPVAYYETI